MSEQSDYDEVRCPLPVVRIRWDEDSEIGPELGVCGSPLYVSYRRDEAVNRVGEQDICGPTWEVICVAGHVLLRPDHDWNDDFDRIPFERGFLDEVLARFDAQRPSRLSSEEQSMSNEAQEALAFGPEYHKIQTVFKRDERGVIIPWDWTLPEIAYLADEHWRWTEKVDGTNIRLHWNGSSVAVGGRTDNAQVPAQLVANLEWLTSDVDVWHDIFGDGPATVYGEGFGPKIQSGGQYRADQGFIAFDVNVDGWWLRDADVADVTKRLGLDLVPVMGEWKLTRAVEMVRDGQVTSTWPNARIEGLVGRPLADLYTRKGERIIVKVKVKDWRDYERRSQRLGGGA